MPSECFRYDRKSANIQQGDSFSRFLQICGYSENWIKSNGFQIVLYKHISECVCVRVCIELQGLINRRELNVSKTSLNKNFTKIFFTAFPVVVR